jgi:hypothetical protein
VGTLEAPLSSGRCAGPVDSDLARLTLPVRMGAGKRPAFDLRTSQTFAAGPFTGRLVSTVVMRAAPGAGSGGTSSSSFGGGAPPPHKVLVEQVTLHYRVAPLPGSIQSSFSGESDPFCEALDSCGASGTLALSLGAFSKTYTVTASRIVKRSVDARHAIADLRRGQLFVNGNLLSVPLVGTETLVRADGSRCQDSVRNGVIFTVGRFPPARGTGVFLAQANTGSDALRTHCPGPSSADVLGGGQDGQPLFARGPLDPPQLLRRHSRLTLSNPGGFSGLGYVGSRAGAVGLSLTLISIRAATKQEEVP